MYNLFKDEKNAGQDGENNLLLSPGISSDPTLFTTKIIPE